jgi:hypothetical protein
LAAINEVEGSHIKALAMSDKRIRDLIGTEKPRIYIGAVEVDKAAADSFLTGAADKPPARRAAVVLFNPQTNKAVRAVVSLEENRILSIESIAISDVPFARDDADEALMLAKRDVGLRPALGDKLRQVQLLEPGNPARPPLGAQALPVRSSEPHDPCSVNRCLDLIFRTDKGYLPVRALVDLTKQTVLVEEPRGP